MRELYDMILKQEMVAYGLWTPGHDPWFDGVLEGYDEPKTYWVAVARAKYIQSMEILGFPPYWVMEKGKAA